MRPTHRELLALALPLVLSHLSIPLLGLVDTAVAGHLPEASSLAAVGVCSAVFSVLFLGFNFLRMGTTGLAAQREGREDVEGTWAVLAQGLLISVVVAATLLATGHWLRELSLNLMDPPEQVWDPARAYFDVRLLAAPFSMANLALAGWFLGRGQVRVPVQMLVSTNVVNMGLDLLLVPYLGWGVSGLAWASVGGESAATLVASWALMGRFRTERPPVRLHHVFDPEAWRALLSVHGDLFLRTLSLTGTLAYFTALAGTYGEAALAANALLLQVQSLMSYGLDGFAHAAEVLVGQAVGMNDRARTRRAIRLSLLWSAIIAAATSLAVLVAGPTLVRSLTDLPDVRQVALDLLPWMIVSPLVSVWAYTFDGVFVGATWSRDMRNTMILSTALFVVAAAGLSERAAHHGLWAAFLLFLGIRGLSLAVLLPRRLQTIGASPA